LIRDDDVAKLETVEESLLRAIVNQPLEKIEEDEEVLQIYPDD